MPTKHRASLRATVKFVRIPREYIPRMGRHPSAFPRI
jgi:hypothetical protein